MTRIEAYEHAARIMERELCKRDVCMFCGQRALAYERKAGLTKLAIGFTDPKPIEERIMSSSAMQQRYSGEKDLRKRPLTRIATYETKRLLCSHRL